MATADLDLNWGGIMGLSPTGDIAIANGTVYGQQRVLRRLLTNDGDYLWHLDYGAGLPQMVGEVVNVGEMTGIIQEQMYLEDCVDQENQPSVAVTNQNDGSVFVEILYTDSNTGDNSVLSLPF